MVVSVETTRKRILQMYSNLTCVYDAPLLVNTCGLGFGYLIYPFRLIYHGRSKIISAKLFFENAPKNFRPSGRSDRPGQLKRELTGTLT